MAGLILECDLGNSRCHWRLRSGDTVRGRGEAALADGFAALPVTEPVERILVASVAEPAVLERLREHLAVLGVAPELARSQARAAGVTNAYGEHFASLGVDRWLAVVAAYQRVGGAALVLDAGSALTADLVDAAGRHLGGYIIPGQRLMQSSLLQETGSVRFAPESLSSGLDFGASTAEAVGAGIFAAQVGAATLAIGQADRRIATGFAILVTGGDGGRLLENLPRPAELVPDLVLDGLAWALPAEASPC